MSVGRVVIERSGRKVQRVLVDGVEVPHVRAVTVQDRWDAPPVVTLELLALADYVDIAVGADEVDVRVTEPGLVPGDDIDHAFATGNVQPRAWEGATPWGESDA